MHPGFGKKSVLSVRCCYCSSNICNRGMKAVLLADTKQELFSTDAPLESKVGSIGRAYSTSQCRCKICDVGCRQCGNVVGYHVQVPCVTCLQSCHNGHLWIFHGNAISAQEVPGRSGSDVLRWDKIAEVSEDTLASDDSFEDLTELECIR